MRVFLLLSVGLSTLLCVCAQTPHPCKAPPYLQGKLAVLNPEGKTRVFEEFYYDAVEQRIRVVAAGEEGSQSFFVDKLLLYRERASYDIIYHNKTCVKTPLTEPFVPIEIPLDAHHRFQFVLGSLSAPAEGLLVNNWEGSIPSIKANFSMTVTEFGCIPISVLYHIENIGHILSSFFDIVVGIENPDAFIPPDFCKNAQLVEREAGAVENFFTHLI